MKLNFIASVLAVPALASGKLTHPSMFVNLNQLKREKEMLQSAHHAPRGTAVFAATPVLAVHHLLGLVSLAPVRWTCLLS